jgi:hypothetical protein
VRRADTAPEDDCHALKTTARTAVGVGVVCLLTLLGVAGVTPAAQEVLFGPVQYTRTSGPPNEFMETVTVLPTLGVPFRLHIQNGNPDGSQRISSAKVWVNGTEVASPADFSQQTAGFDRGVTLQASNTLQVRLTSTPGAFLVLTLCGTVPPPTLSTLEPPTLPITAGARAPSRRRSVPSRRARP